MNNAVARLDIEQGQVIERVILAGDLAKLDPMDRVKYYIKTCESLGMNPFTKPFDLITLNGKMILYPNKTGTDQLRQIKKVSVGITGRSRDGDILTVTAKATTPDGRYDESTGVVFLGGLKGELLSNACMKCETKAKRRVTLSIVGLGWLDESEVSSIAGAKRHTMDIDTGAIIDVSDPNSSNQGAKVITGKPSGTSTVSNKAPPVPKTVMDEILKISALKKELVISDDELKAELARLDLPPTLKGMKLDQLQRISSLLEDEKLARNSIKAHSREPGEDDDEVDGGQGEFADAAAASGWDDGIPGGPLRKDE